MFGVANSLVVPPLFHEYSYSGVPPDIFAVSVVLVFSQTEREPEISTANTAGWVISIAAVAVQELASVTVIT